VNDELIGFEFPVEDGLARVVGPSASSGSTYYECRVTTTDGAVYTTVRPAGLVRQAKEGTWSSSAG
jgi:hypothetical protein